MHGFAATLAAGVTVVVWAGQPTTVVTVAQQDAQRSYLDTASASVSADGGYVAFRSYARLVPADTNDDADIYVLHRADGRVTLESAGHSDHPSISGDGRFLVFETDGEVVLVDRDRDVRQTLVDGSQPSISADGRFVVFASGGDVYRLDVGTRLRQSMSVDGSGVRLSGGAIAAPSVSADGRFVAFAFTPRLNSAPGQLLTSTASAGRALSHVYVRDVETGTMVQVRAGGGPADGNSWAPAVSANGRYVAFASAATNLVPGDRNQSPDVFLADLHDGALQLVSRGRKGDAGNGASGHPAISADGRLVAFQSAASDLVCAGRCTAASEDINLLWDVFLFDSQTRAITCLSSDREGGWMEASAGPSLDAQGDVVAFSSRHPVNARDTKNDFDLFIVSSR